jgi:hypothetical protein
MQFHPVSAQRHQTRVDVLPSSPDGYFRIDDDPYLSPYGVGSIALRDVKPRHVRALEKGDTSVMSMYVVPDSERLDIVSFAKCDPSIPDPHDPRGTIYVRTAQEVHLDRKRAGQIHDAHRAVGEWWAQRLLNPIVDIHDGEVIRDVPDEVHPDALQKAGDFALILADLSRTSDIAHISVDYQPDPTLREAADLALVPAVFSLKSYTARDAVGNIMAKEGRNGDAVQIWPPTSQDNPA